MVKRVTRRGSAGDDVTETEAYTEQVIDGDNDESYVTEDVESAGEVETTAEIITDDHDVVAETDAGGEEEFMAEACDEAGAKDIKEDGEAREGGRKGDAEDSEEKGKDEAEDVAEEVVDVIVNENGDTEEVELPDQQEDKREGSRKGKSEYEEAEDEEADEETEDDTKEDEDEQERDGRKGIAVERTINQREVHAESIKAAVQLAMRDRRL